MWNLFLIPVLDWGGDAGEGGVGQIILGWIVRVDEFAKMIKISCFTFEVYNRIIATTIITIVAGLTLLIFEYQKSYNSYLLFIVING